MDLLSDDNVGDLMSYTLFSATQKAGLVIRKAAEVGVLSFKSSAIREFVVAGVRCDLYEAVPDFCSEIAKDIRAYPETVLHQNAVSDYSGTMVLCMAGPSTFNAALSVTPATNQNGFDKSTAQMLEVNCVDFADVDPGDYDLISIDVEGGEYSILSHMKSRPKVIALETQSRYYCNPKLGAITDWMLENGYSVWIWHDTDTVFFKGKPPNIGTWETIKSKWHSFRHYAQRI